MKSSLVFILLLISLTVCGQSIVARGETIHLVLDQSQQAALKSTGEPPLKQMLHLGNKDHLIKISETSGKDGSFKVKYRQYHNEIPIEHSSVLVSGISGNPGVITCELYDIPPGLDKVPSMSEEEAYEIAIRYIQDIHKTSPSGINDDHTSAKRSKGELVYVRTFISGSHYKEGEMALAYKFDIYILNPVSRDYVYVDVHHGEVVHKNAIIKHAGIAQASTRFSGSREISTTFDATKNKYVLKDDSRGQGIETYNLKNEYVYARASDFTDNDNDWSAAEFNNIRKDNAALDAHWGAINTYDYFLTQHGRDSYDGNGAKITSYVHFGFNYVNAFWNGEAMTYGDGDASVNPLTSLDICAHEIAHAVCSHTADLTYYGQSGALNEGLSDIWGATIEHFAAPEKSTWDLGEDINLIIRSMADPNAHQQPDTYLGDYWYKGSGDNGGVHFNSGVLNHWYHILVEGKSGVNDHGFNFDVTGIGFEAAARIVYQMETTYLTSNSQYKAARNAAILAATDLYGAGSNEVIQTTKAWEAVGLYEESTAPTQLIANIISKDGINLVWRDNSTTETSFVIERSQSANSGFVPIRTLPANTSSYNDLNLEKGVYYYRVKAIVNGFNTIFSNIASTGWLDVEPLLITNGNETACGKVFLDAGGVDNYYDNDDYVMTVFPEEPGKKVKVSFSSFKMSREQFGIRGDYFQIYDGTSLYNTPFVQFNDMQLPPDYTATNAEGALTFRFYSYHDNHITDLGWHAYLSCENAPPAPTNLTVNGLSPTQVQLTWQDISDVETGYVIERYTSSNATSIINAQIKYKTIATVPANTTEFVDEVEEEDLYSYRVKALKGTTYSGYSNVATIQLSRPPFTMTDGEFAVCDSPILDPGGYGKYGTNSYVVTTLAPSEAGKVLSLHFHEFNLEEGFDYLAVYDGGSINAPFINWFTGKSLPPDITATNPEGKLTLEFYSDYSIEYSGFRATLSCISRPEDPTNLLAVVDGDDIRLTWEDNATDETGYILEKSLGGEFITVGTFGPNVIEAVDPQVASNRDYSYRVRAVRSGVFSDYSNTFEITFGNSHLLMSNGEVTVCSKAFLDEGGDQGYFDNSTKTLTIIPEVPGTKIKVDFSLFDLEEGYDFLSVFDGPSLEHPLIGVYTGTELPPVIQADNADGKLTFLFKSDNYVYGSGWEAFISCVTPDVAPTNLTAGFVAPDKVELNWEDNSAAETGYIVERATGNKFVEIATLDPDTEFFEDLGLINDRKYTYRIRSLTGTTKSNPSNEALVINGNEPVVMHTGNVQTCNAVFLDPGGDEDHGSTRSIGGSVLNILTITPDEPGKQVSVNFNSLEIGGGTVFNHLRAFNGDPVEENLIGTVSNQRNVIQSSNPEGKLTFIFQAFVGIPGSGWEASITCVDKGIPQIIFADQEIGYKTGNINTTAYSYKGAAITYSILDDGSNTAGGQLVATQTGQFITVERAGTVRIKASVPETDYFFAGERIKTLTVNKVLPELWSFNFDTKIGNAPAEIEVDTYEGADYSFSIIGDPRDTGEIILSGPGNRFVTPVKAGTVFLNVHVAENDRFTAADNQGIAAVKAIDPVISFTDIQADVTDPTFDLNASAYEGASFIYGIVDGQNAGEVQLSGPGNQTITPVKAGTVKVRVYVPSTQNYFAGEKIAVITITQSKVSQSITFNEIGTKIYGQEPFDLIASASSSLPVQYTSSNSAIAQIDEGKVMIRGAGQVTITATQPGNESYEAATPVERLLTIEKKSLIVSPLDEARPYGSTNPLFTISYSYFVNGDTETDLDERPSGFETEAGPGSNAGTYPVTISNTGFDDNYELIRGFGQLTITKANQTITFDEIEDKFNDEIPFSITASSTSSLPVSFSVISGPANVSGNQLSLTGEIGRVELEAYQVGNLNYHPAEPVRKSFEVLLNPILSLDENSKKSVVVWPNPAAKSVTIESSQSEITVLTMTDILGRPVLFARPETKSCVVDLTFLEHGIYLVKTRTSEGRTVIHQLHVIR